MNAKALGGGAFILLCIGGFIGYDRWQEHKAQKKFEAERAQEAVANEKRAESEKVKTATWTTMPDLKGKKPDEVAALLVKAGFGEVEVVDFGDNSVCSYEDVVDDPSDMVPQGAICHQEPPSGARVRAERVRVRYLIEEDTFEHGGVDTQEWRRMPNVLDMSVEEAKALLASKGFGPDEFSVDDVGDRCPSKTVCETNPRAGQRKYKSNEGTLSASLK